MTSDMSWSREGEWDFNFELNESAGTVIPTSSTLSNNRTLVPAPLSTTQELNTDPFYLDAWANTNAQPVQSALTRQNIIHHQQQAQHGISHPSLTSSASCPSFTSLYDVNNDDLLRELPNGEPIGESELFPSEFLPPSMYSVATEFYNNAATTPTTTAGGYDYVMEFQQQHSNSTMRNFPHHQAPPLHVRATIQRPSRQLRTSASFTSLSSMETEHRSRMASKRKKGVKEQWYKQQRHKSFDSTTSSVRTAPSPSASSGELTALNAYDSVPPQSPFLEQSTTESEMIGFSLDEFPMSFTSDASWPCPTSSTPVGSSPTPIETTSDAVNVLLDERANDVSSVLDAIYDSMDAEQQEEPQPTPPSTCKAQKKQPQPPTIAPTVVATVSIRQRIQRVLLPSPHASHDTMTLTPAESTYLDQSPLFTPTKAIETAGSLWLLLHASTCTETPCSTVGCDVMRRVIKHCQKCEAALGDCRDPCNEAKAMLLHHATCRQPLSCSVCTQCQAINETHTAQVHSSQAPRPTQVHIAPQPTVDSPTLVPRSVSKHVAIQPNPLPVSSNPMDVMASVPPLGISLAIYLEQTSTAFRTEVNARIEQRVTASAGQDLIQHMQKKTRLRSLDNLRSEARVLVLGEMELELQRYLQSFNVEVSPTSQAHVPSYLLNVAASGIAALYAQQVSFQAALATMPPIPIVSQGSPNLPNVVTLRSNSNDRSSSSKDALSSNDTTNEGAVAF